MTTYRFARTSPGFTWIRRACIYRGDFAVYLWRRSAWRIAWAWVALVGVFAFFAYGACK